MNKRQESNFEILDILFEAAMEYPDMRFGQLLVNLNIIEIELGSDLLANVRDPFYNEPNDILERVKNSRMYQDNNL